MKTFHTGVTFSQDRQQDHSNDNNKLLKKVTEDSRKLWISANQRAKKSYNLRFRNKVHKFNCDCYSTMHWSHNKWQFDQP